MWPLIEVALEPITQGDAAALASHVGDLGLTSKVDYESGQTTLCGDSEPELDSAIGLLINKHGIALNIGAPQVAYRERLGHVVTIDHTHRRQAGGVGQFARVQLRFEPRESGSDVIAESEIVDGAIPAALIPGILDTLRSAMAGGVLAGFPLIQCRASLIGGAYHEVDSTDLAFAIATRAAYRELREKGDPRIMEPVMSVCIDAPEDCAAAIREDLRRRRAVFEQTPGVAIAALVPLANLFGYAPTLHHLSGGRASHSWRFSHYQDVPQLPGPGVFPGAMAMRA